MSNHREKHLDLLTSQQGKREQRTFRKSNKQAVGI